MSDIDDYFEEDLPGELADGIEGAEQSGDHADLLAGIRAIGATLLVELTDIYGDDMNDIIAQGDGSGETGRFYLRLEAGVLTCVTDETALPPASPPNAWLTMSHEHYDGLDAKGLGPLSLAVSGQLDADRPAILRPIDTDLIADMTALDVVLRVLIEDPEWMREIPLSIKFGETGREDPDVTAKLTLASWTALVRGELSMADALSKGALEVDGDADKKARLAKLGSIAR